MVAATVGDQKESVASTVAPGASASLPLEVAGPAGASAVICSTVGGTAATVSSSLNAIQTSSNN